jgi:C-terminal processing protease CtpA/Prc
VEVNGISMVDVTHEDAVAALMMDPTGVVMRVARMPENQPGEETFQIEFPKLSTGLGFSIAGGIDDAVSPGDTAIYVTNIVPGGSAELDGRLKFEDRVLAANGHNFGCISHAQAVKILQSNPTGVKLIVSRFMGEEPLDESCA